jgi:DNA-binding IclR family transcriptional regulator
MNKQTGNNRRVIASVQHALDILNLFEESYPEIGNNDIAKMLKMDPGTVAGLVYTLKLNHYLDQNPDNRKYRLGMKLAERASMLLNQIDLRKIAAPYLEELRQWSGESINLAIRDHTEVVYIERLMGHHALGIRSELGKRACVHSTALGKAILASMIPEEIQAILADYEFIPVTPNTITNLKDFLKELDRVRKTGYAIDEEENELGGRCLAAPVFNNSGVPVAAVSISVPVQRLPREQVSEYGTRIKETTLEISRTLGYSPDNDKEVQQIEYSTKLSEVNRRQTKTYGGK